VAALAVAVERAFVEVEAAGDLAEGHAGDDELVDLVAVGVSADGAGHHHCVSSTIKSWLSRSSVLRDGRLLGGEADQLLGFLDGLLVQGNGIPAAQLPSAVDDARAEGEQFLLFGHDGSLFFSGCFDGPVVIS
jgi:hypothetical protein